MSHLLQRSLSALVVLSFFTLSIKAQPTIAWQRSLGTENSDTSLKLFKDKEGHLIVIGTEPHQDFTGNWREYMAVTKLDNNGNQIWKSYHDVAFETFNPPYDYYIGDHLFTEEFGEKLISLVVYLNNHVYLLKLLESTGQYYTYEEISSGLIDVKPNNDKVYAVTQCSYQFSCYGPDSLIVQKFDPTPDSIFFNPIKWTYEVRQNIRTAPIQGHYDFDGQDIREDEAGNVYLLIQIERWDFQFCTDCNDAFIDAWCEVFKFNAQGQLVKHQRIVTSKAVVSAMRFVKFAPDEMIIRVDDINAAGTAIVSSVYHVDSDLNVGTKFSLGRQYNYIIADDEDNIYGCTNIYDPNNPDIHGESDAFVSKFNPTGQLLWSGYYGGSSYEFPRGFVQSNDGDLVFLSNTESSDGDVAENLGGQDMWVVKLGEATATEENDNLIYFTYTNPVSQSLYYLAPTDIQSLDILDMNGVELKHLSDLHQSGEVNMHDLVAGVYLIRVESEKVSKTFKVVKL